MEITGQCDAPRVSSSGSGRQSHERKRDREMSETKHFARRITYLVEKHEVQR